MLRIKTILFATDFSSHAEHAFHLACALARDYDARLLIFHVQMPPAVMSGDLPVLPIEMESVEVCQQRRMQIRPRDANIACEHFFTIGAPADEIVRLAREKHADLIVIGTHGRRGIGRLLMGSVAEQVVRTADCPVMTIKAPIAATEEMNTRAAQAAT